MCNILVFQRIINKRKNSGIIFFERIHKRKTKCQKSYCENLGNPYHNTRQVSMSSQRRQYEKDSFAAGV